MYIKNRQIKKNGKITLLYIVNYMFYK